jgi:hypothetical protein
MPELASFGDIATHLFAEIKSQPRIPQRFENYTTNRCDPYVLVIVPAVSCHRLPQRER